MKCLGNPKGSKKVAFIASDEDSISESGRAEKAVIKRAGMY